MNKENPLKKREENFNRIKENLESEGYMSEKVCIHIVYANVVAVIIGLVLGSAMYWVFHRMIPLSEVRIPLLAFVICLLCIVLHEALHGITWAMFCKRKWKSIQFGVLWKYLTPYCSCMEVLSWKPYILGGLMPFLVLGIGFYVIALCTGNNTLLWLSIMNVIGAGGDCIIAYNLLKNHEGMIMDLPSECGYMRFYKDK